MLSIRPFWRQQSGALAASMLIAAVIGFSFIAPRTVAAQRATCDAYSVTLDGTASIGSGTSTSATQQFTVDQIAILRSAGYNSHRGEFVLSSNVDLNAAPQIGYVDLMTNSAFANNAGIASAAYDLTTYAPSGRGAQFTIDGSMSYVLPSPNVFVAPGVGADPYGLGGIGLLPGLRDFSQSISSSPILSSSYLVPRSGSGSVTTSDGGATISGELSLVGSALDNANFQGRYRATFRGSYLGSMAC